MPSILWSFLLLPTIYVINTYWCLYQNVQLAKRSRLPYVVVAWYSFNRLTSLFNTRVRSRFLDRYFPEPPRPEATPRRLVKTLWPLRLHYAPFSELGSDSFLTVSPGGVILFTADADVISQITARSNDFPKPTQLYLSVDIYGKNIVSSEGAAWRHHRKSTAHSFTEKTNQLVWYETLEQTQSMLAAWIEPSRKTIQSIAGDTMRLSLHIMSKAGLGRKMDWPTKAGVQRPAEDQNTPAGHKMNFTDCLNYLLRNIIWVMFVPKAILCRAPSSRLRTVFDAYEEFGTYMHEMIESEKALNGSSGTDLVSQLVRGQSDDLKTPGLTDSEVIGNLFVFIIAGHETSASSIHFSLVLLALHPSIQRRAQRDLDRIFGKRPPREWSYETDLPKLQSSYLAAVLNEQLRVIPPTMAIPKVATTTQTLTINNKPYEIPRGTMIRLCIPAVHRNPKFWPSTPSASKDSPHPSQTSKPINDLDEFKPDRWLLTNSKADKDTNRDNDARPISTTSVPSPDDPANETLYNPPKGAYIPFSLDSRACLGKRFAQVEILAALASILSTHTIELAVDEFVGKSSSSSSRNADTPKNGKDNDDDDIGEILATMSNEEKGHVWRQARDKGNWTWRTQTTAVITVQLKSGAGVPVRVVRRGKELFGEDVLGAE